MRGRRVLKWLRESTTADVLLAGAALAPLVVLLVRQILQLDNPTVPCCDFAALELGTRAFVRGEQFLGLYSREGWRHPGPAPFAWDSLFRPLPGHSFAEHQVAAASLALGSLAGVIISVWRRVSSLGRSVTMILVAVFIARFGVNAFAVPWNPYAAALWSLLAVCAVSVYAVGRTRSALIIAVVTASMAAQTHVGAAPTAVVCAVTIGGTIIRHRRSQGSMSQVAIAVSAGIVMWLLPIADMILGHHNAWQILASSSTSVPVDRGEIMTSAMWIVGNSPGAIGSTFGPASPFVDTRGVILLDLAAVVVVTATTAVAIVRRRTDTFVGTAASVAGASLLLTVAALLVANGPYFRYLMLPIAGLGLVLWLVTGLTCARPIPSHEAKMMKVLAWPAVGVLTTMSILGVDTNRFTDRYDNPDVSAVVADIGTSCNDVPATAVVEIAPDIEWFDALPILVGLERCSVVRVIGPVGFLAGQPYRADDSQQPTTFITSGEVPQGAVLLSRHGAFAVSVASS